MSQDIGPEGGIADRVYRGRWWLSGLLVGALVVLGPSAAPTSTVTWTLFALLLLLVWIPVLVRWTQAARSERTAFREGVSDAERR